jgi:hypothetical protein
MGRHAQPAKGTKAASEDSNAGREVGGDSKDKVTRPRNPGKYSPNVSIASASRAPAPSYAGEVVTELKSASAVQID